MSTFLHFYKIDKNKVPEKTLRYLNVDQIESSVALDEEASFFDLTLLWENPGIVSLTRFSRWPQMRQTMNAFMSSKGITDDIYNTSMVMSESLIGELLAYLDTSPVWNTEDTCFTARRKERALNFFQGILNTHDFDNEYFFYTYY